MQSRNSSRDDEADFVLRGGVQGTHRPQVNLQLLNAVSGACLWAERCEVGYRHAEIARLMFDVSAVMVRDVNRRIEALSRSDLTPHELMLRGHGSLLLPASPANRHLALRCFERALALQPDSIAARLGIAGVLISRLSSHWSRTVEHDEARVEALLLDAFQAASDTTVGHALRGTLRRLQGRLDESRMELELATDAAPCLGMVASQLGMTLLFCGQPEAALTHFEAGALGAAGNPQRSLLLNNLGTCRLLLGDTHRAIEVLREATENSPQHSIPALTLAAALGLRSASAEASAFLQRGIGLCPSLGTLSDYDNWMRRQASPHFMPIYQDTLRLGLQRAGMPSGA